MGLGNSTLLLPWGMGDGGQSKKEQWVWFLFRNQILAKRV